MSASLVRLEEDKRRKNIISYHFHQAKPIPSYAVVVAVGFLRRMTIGPRSCMFIEDKFFHQNIETFAEIDRMLLAAENLCGPYVFGRISIHSLFKFMCILNFLFVLSTFVFFFLYIIII